MKSGLDLELLLTVADRFEVAQLGLVLAPDFSVPGGRWRGRAQEVTVEAPDGRRFEALAMFDLTHVNIRAPEVSVDRRWRVTVRIPGVDEELVPIGSRVFADPRVVAVLHGRDEA